MSKLFRLMTPLYAPEDMGGGGGSETRILPSGDSKEDMIDFLADDGDDNETIDLEGEGKGKKEPKEKPAPKGEKKDKETPDDDEIPAEDEEDSEGETEDDELAEIEAELEEPSEEQLELVTPVRRREILKKYPQLFKDFPYLEKAYYREQQFTEIFPTIEDAKAAGEKGEVLDRFEKDLMSGNAETVLKAVQQTNPKAFMKMVDDYLPTLSRVDEKAYFHVLGNVTKHTIIAMVNEARRLGVGQGNDGQPLPGTALQQAAHLVNQFVFGSSEFQPPTNLSREDKPEDNSREKQISEREQGFIRQQFESARGDLNTRVNNTLRNTIDANIDPKSSMSDYVRKNASRDALDSLETLINQDGRFKTLVDKLWEKAFESNFSRESVDRIRSAYVSKAKTLLPSVIKKARNEALRGMGKRVKDDSEEETTSRRGPVPAGRPRSQSQNTGKIRDAKDIPAGMSTLEFLNSD